MIKFKVIAMLPFIHACFPQKHKHAVPCAVNDSWQCPLSLTTLLPTGTDWYTANIYTHNTTSYDEVFAAIESIRKDFDWLAGSAVTLLLEVVASNVLQVGSCDAAFF